MASYEDIVNSLISSSNGSNETSTKISQALLDQLKKKYALEEGTDNGQIKTNSTFDKIQKQVDIDGETETDSEILAKFQSLIDTSNNQAKNLWNESIKVAVNYFIKRFLDENAVIPVSSETGLGQSEQGGFLIKDIRHANAGLSFNGTAWVKPNYNIDNDIYDDVRGDDKIESVLNNQRNMQFTRTQDQSQIVSETINKYIRLLMPQYTRRVEVEDLNRNFWVIGQVLAGISAYLFDEDSPITNMFKRLISEVNQLWENILYLWTAFNKPITKVHSEVLYLPRKKAKEKRYDDIEDSVTIQNSDIVNRISFLVEQYTDSNLIVLPIIRNRSYKHNYYKNEVYKGLWFYDRNQDKWFRKKMEIPETYHFGEYKKNNGGYVEFNINEKNAKYITGIYETDEQYNYIFPLTDAVQDNHNYIGGLRLTPQLTGSYSNGAFSASLQITASDLGTYICSISAAHNITHSWSGEQLTISSGTLTHDIIANPDEATLTPPEPTSGVAALKNGYYLGEMPSCPARHLSVAGLSLRQINIRPLKENIRDFSTNGARINSLKTKATEIIGLTRTQNIDYVPTLRVGHYRNDARAVNDNGSVGYFWYNINGLHKYTYTEDNFNASIFQFDSNNDLDLIKISGGDEYPAAINFRGSFFVGAELYLPNFDEPQIINYNNYQNWTSTTPLVWMSGADIGQDSLQTDIVDNVGNVVTLLSQTENGSTGRQYAVYNITEFFRRNKDEDYDLTNWAIRFTQLGVLFGPEYDSTDASNYKNKFWHTNPLSETSQIMRTYWDEHGQSRDYSGLVARRSVHCFSVDSNGNPLYTRSEFNRLVVKNINNENKLYWKDQSNESDKAKLDVTVDTTDGILKSLVRGDIPSVCQLEFTGSNIPNFGKSGYTFNFFRYPIRGWDGQS